jgi:cytochrome c peroxidase
MAGNVAENEVIGAVTDRIDLGWPILAKRVRTQGGYGDDFVDAFDHIDAPDEVTIVEVANALAAFMIAEWTSIDSAFDRYLAGDATALTSDQFDGMQLFYGKANCSSCHSGALMTDQRFYALGLPAFGPGRTRRFDPVVRDVGRMGESDELEDAYRFRTPMLRNVALTAPYGHNGAFPTLEGIVRHHLDPVASRAKWRREDAALPKIPWLEAIDFLVQEDRFEMARQAARLDITPIELSDTEVMQIVAFLQALTGEGVENARFGVPHDFVE